MRSAMFVGLLLLVACDRNEAKADHDAVETVATPASPVASAAPAKSDKVEPQNQPAIFLTAFGTEPFWTFEVTQERFATPPSGASAIPAQGNGVWRMLRYSTLEKPDPVRIPAWQVHEGNRLRYTGIVDGTNFELVIELLEGKDKCSDGMSDADHQFEARYTIYGGTYPGCANLK